jgi:hypothetical protein
VGYHSNGGLPCVRELWVAIHHAFALCVLRIIEKSKTPLCPQCSLALTANGLHRFTFGYQVFEACVLLISEDGDRANGHIATHQHHTRGVDAIYKACARKCEKACLRGLAARPCIIDS